MKRPKKVPGGRDWSWLRVDQDLYDVIERLAKDDERSTTNYANRHLRATLPTPLGMKIKPDVFEIPEDDFKGPLYRNKKSGKL